MGKKLDKRFILSDNSVNRYGYRVLTDGLNVAQFKKNPVMLWMHMRDEGSGHWCDYKPIGHWEDIEVSDSGELSACPYFDLTDDLSREICAKVEEGTIRATSIGLIPITFSEDARHLLPGQKRASVIKADLMEASFCDIPANRNAVRLYSESEGLTLNFAMTQVPLIKDKTMKLKDSMQALLSFLGIEKEKAQETDLTEEQLTKINDEIETLRSQNGNHEKAIERLKADHKAETDALKTDIATLTSSRDALMTENLSLRDQVENLKKTPSDTPNPVVTKEPLSQTSSPLEELAAFCKTTDDTSEIIAKGQQLGVF